MTATNINIAIRKSDGYYEEFVRNLFETIIANRKMEEELERAKKLRLSERERKEGKIMVIEELKREEILRLAEHELKEKGLELKFD
ncbi:hypothetical protein TNCV_4447911 [Trichonephila clavipes]|nr:hypothetical protein TNCV_4447911 [Trichonephila clavipes]